jgi:hypothetical protein
MAIMTNKDLKTITSEDLELQPITISFVLPKVMAEYFYLLQSECLMDCKDPAVYPTAPAETKHNSILMFELLRNNIEKYSLLDIPEREDNVVSTSN